MNRFVFAFFILLFAAPLAKAAGLIEESMTLPASFQGLFGADTVDLDTLVVRPNDDQRHPMVVINHGTPRDALERKHASPRAMRGQAREFARRGWVAVTFTRRGFGASGGHYAESIGSCGMAIYEPAGRAAAEDVREVIRLMRDKPYVDGSRIVSVGRSTGGFTTVALTAAPPPGLVAAINFAGGHGSSAPDQVCHDTALIAAFAAYGKTSRIPMLWVYAENDHYFGPALAKQFYEAFTGSGGKAAFIAAPPFGTDGHNLFSRIGIPIWSTYVDAFLDQQNLRLLPQPLPIEEAAEVHTPDGLGDRGKTAFLDFLDAPEHKAFVMSADGHFGWRSRRDSVEEAVEQAMAFCKENTDRQCRTVMTDDGMAP